MDRTVGLTGFTGLRPILCMHRVKTAAGAKPPSFIEAFYPPTEEKVLFALRKTLSAYKTAQSLPRWWVSLCQRISITSTGARGRGARIFQQFSPFCPSVYTHNNGVSQGRWNSFQLHKVKTPGCFPNRIRATACLANNFSAREPNLPLTRRGKRKHFGLNFCTILYFDSSVYEPRPVRTATCCVTTHSEGFPPSRLTHLHLYPPSPPTQKARRKKKKTPKQKEKSQKNKMKLLDTTVEIIIIIINTKNLKKKQTMIKTPKTKQKYHVKKGFVIDFYLIPLKEINNTKTETV